MGCRWNNSLTLPEVMYKLNVNINGVGGLGATTTTAATVGPAVGGYDDDGRADAVPLTDSIFSGTDSVYGDGVDESKRRVGGGGGGGMDGTVSSAGSSASSLSIYANAALASATRLGRTGFVTIHHRETDPRLLAFALSRRTKLFSLENCSFVIPPPPGAIAYGNSSSAAAAAAASATASATATAVTNARIAVQREFNLPLNLTFEISLYKKLGRGMPKLHCGTSDYFR